MHSQYRINDKGWCGEFFSDIDRSEQTIFLELSVQDTRGVFSKISANYYASDISPILFANLKAYVRLQHRAGQDPPDFISKPAIDPSIPSLFVYFASQPDIGMNLRDHDTDDGKKVWLSEDELDQLVEAAGDMEKRLVIELGGRCGLRSAEILDVASQDVVETDAGHMLRVWQGKGDKFRETPISESVATRVEAVAYRNDCDPDESVFSVASTRSIRRWVSQNADELAEITDDRGWRFLSTHDLRRTWATALSDAEVDPLLVLEWGGWEDLETFLEHYKGTYSPAAQRRARKKVRWL